MTKRALDPKTLADIDDFIARHDPAGTENPEKTGGLKLPPKRSAVGRNWLKRHKKLTICLLIILLLAIYQPIADQLTLSSADPNIKKLAQDAGMSRAGELIFLRTHPTLVDVSAMATDCQDTSTQDGYVEQGCYLPQTNQIYIRQMPDELHDIELVTAVHEMLHAVYNSSQPDPAVKQQLEDEFHELNNSDLNSRMNEYAKIEPGSQDDELHSILGSEIGSLPAGLESYYSQYLTNRQAAVTANSDVENIFDSDQAQMDQQKAAIDAANTQADRYYAQSVYYARLGDAYYDDYYYNLYSNEYDLASGLINKYNQLVDQYNQLAAEYNGTPVSQLQTQQLQSN